MADSRYILVTPARNEGEHIGDTIRSVVAQTCLPRRWLIVSDGSTDRTDQIVAEAAAQYPFIELLRVDADADRNFGSKAVAVNAGYRRIQDTEHDFVGILDADVTFEPNYYEQVMLRFDKDPQLGIAGGVLTDVVNGRPVRQLTAPDWSVSGPIQMFRRECWQKIGGYLPIRGGIDAAAEVMARKNGWTVRAFYELSVIHLRQTGKENHSVAGIYFHRGLEDYRLGYHPLFFLAKSIRHSQSSPVILGGLLMVCGYFWAGVRRDTKTLPEETIRFLRQEQISRMRAALRFGEKKNR